MRATVRSEKTVNYELQINCIILIAFAMQNLTILVENELRAALKFVMTRVAHVRFDTFGVDQGRANWGLA